MRGRSGKTISALSVSDVVEEKQRIKSELATIEQAGGLRGRLASCLEHIRDSSEEKAPLEQARTLIYTNHALLCHERGEPLAAGTLEVMLKLVNLIAISNGLKERSRFSFLLTDTHSILSQVCRRRGQHFEAAWELLSGMEYLHNPDPKQQAFLTMSRAIRELRIGNGDACIKFLDMALSGGLEESHVGRAHYTKLIALRLSGRHEELRDCISAARRLVPSGQMAIDIAWQEICWRVQESGDFVPMLSAIKESGSHFDNFYYKLEAHLWALASSSKSNHDLCPPLDREHINFTSQTTAFSAVCKNWSAITKFYDHKVSAEKRLQDLGRALGNVRQCFGVEFELLILAAAWRALIRHKKTSFAELVLKEYEGLSLKLSNGRQRDALGLA